MLLADWLCRLKQRPHGIDRVRNPRTNATVVTGMQDWMLEDRVMLSGTPIEMPTDTVATADQVLYHYGTGPNEIDPQYEKTLLITNNSDQTIYPFLEAKNDRTPAPNDPTTQTYLGTGAFDNYDPANQEYRAYIGYVDHTDPNNPVTLAGLPAHSSITVIVPIAFWDGGRVNFATDGTDLFQTAATGASDGAPFFYHDDNTQANYFAYVDPAHLDRLYFQPIYNSFDAAAPHMPSAANWTLPSVLKDGMTVTGVGLPAAG